MTEAWVKAAQPILTPSQPWELNIVGEPSIIHDACADTWRMLYFGGWGSAQLGYAKCVGDPRIAANWVKHDGPVIGPGVGNFWARPAHACWVFDQQTGLYTVLFSIFGTAGVNMWMATTPDPDTVPFTVHPIPVLPTGYEDRVMGNASLYYEGGIWYNLYDAIKDPSVDIWKTYLARASSLAGPWVKDTHGPFPSLQVGTGCYGGWSKPKKVNGKYHVWGINAPAGNTPSEIYHHYSVEMTNWGVLNGGRPVLSITTEYADQIADPAVEEWGGVSLMFYDTVHNPTAAGAIWVAAIDAPLESFCT